MSTFNNKNFNKLRDKWYKKLEASGFKDAETTKGKLKISAKEVLRDYRINTKQSKEDYFAMADQFLNEYSFDSNFEKIIWEYHCNGLGVHAIVDTLRKAKIAKTNRTSIGLIISTLREIMKSKYLKVSDE